MSDGLNRREVLAAAGAAMVAGSARAAEPPAKKGNTRGIKKSLMWSMVAGKAPVMDKFKLLKDVGFDGVEMDSPARTPTKAEILEARDKTGLAVSGVVDAVHWTLHLS